MIRTVLDTFFQPYNWKNIKVVFLTTLGMLTSLAVAFIVFQPTQLFLFMPTPDEAYAADLNRKDGHVFIYVVDSGVDPSANQTYAHVVKGYNAIEDAPGGNDDCTGHGTSVAGVIANMTYEKKVTIVPVKTGECTKAHDPVSIVRGINWIVENHPENAPTGVINISLGYIDNIPFLDGLQNAVQTALDAGFVVVTSAGNESVDDKGNPLPVVDACSAVPANVPDAITVGSAIEKNKGKVLRSYFSNSGSCIDVFAPGENIPIVKKVNGSWDKLFGYGTSYASPYVAAVAANMISADPDLDRLTVEEYIKKKAIKGVILDTLDNPLEVDVPVFPELNTPNLFLKVENISYSKDCEFTISNFFSCR